MATDTDKMYATAAGHIAGAVATAYLGPAGGALADEAVTAIASALLSGDDDKMQKEIISKLDVINTKIDQILVFCNSGFREIVDLALDADAIKTLMIDISNSQTAMSAAMDAYAKGNPPTEADALRVITSAEGLLAKGRQIFARSRDHFLIAIPYFAHAFGALVMVQRSNPKFNETAALWSERYLADLTPWMTQGQPGSFLEIKSRLEKEIATVESAMFDFHGSVPSCLVNSIMYLPIGNITVGFGAEYTVHPDGHVTATDLPLPARARHVLPTEDMFPVWGMKAPNWFVPRVISERNDAYWTDVFEHIRLDLEKYARARKELPKRLELLIFATKVLIPFMAGLKAMSSSGTYLIVEAAAAKAAAAGVVAVAPPL